MKNPLKDPLTRRLISGSAFAAAFVWVAASYYSVSMNEILRFLIMSFVLVGAMVVVGFLLAPLLVRLNRKPSLKVPSKDEEPSSKPEEPRIES